MIQWIGNDVNLVVGVSNLSMDSQWKPLERAVGRKIVDVDPAVVAQKSSFWPVRVGVVVWPTVVVDGGVAHNVGLKLNGISPSYGLAGSDVLRRRRETLAEMSLNPHGSEERVVSR